MVQMVHRPLITPPANSLPIVFWVLLGIASWPCNTRALSLRPAQDTAGAVAGSSAASKKRVKPIPYIATTSTVEHARCLSRYLREGDRVLELGTQLDQSSTCIVDAIGPTGHATLVDVARTETNSGRTSQGTRDAGKFLTTSGGESSNHDYVELEAFADWRTVLDAGGGDDAPLFDVLVLDATAVLGNDLELTALSVVREFVDDAVRRGRRPRAAVVKSKAVSSLARRLVHAQRLFDGTAAPRDLKRPRRDGRPHIVAGVGVEEYRRTIPHVVRPGDECVEVGCFSGTTTALVHEAAEPGFAIGVDIGPKIIDRAKREHEDMEFFVGDAWKSLELLRMKKRAYPESPSGELDGYDVVYADIGGLSGPDGTLESLSLLDGLGYALEPRCIVIKSLCMRRLASSLRAYSEVWEKENNINASANQG